MPETDESDKLAALARQRIEDDLSALNALRGEVRDATTLRLIEDRIEELERRLHARAD